jgi:phosphoglycolate phosphatase
LGQLTNAISEFLDQRRSLHTVTDLSALDGATIAFDLDGTLVESAPDLIGAVNAVLIAEGFEPLAYDPGRPYISRGARWLLQWGLAAAGAQESSARAAILFDRFISHCSAHIADESRPFPGVIDALKVLKAAGASLVVCTNKPTSLSRSLLTKLDMAGFFDGVVGVDAVSAMKPDAAHLIEAIAAVGGDLARTAMVGDADTDAGAARAAGTPLILVDFGYTEIPAAELAPDTLLHHFDDLVGACVGLLKGPRPVSPICLLVPTTR